MRGAAAFWLGAATLLAVGCGPAACPDDDPDVDEGNPVIEEIRLLQGVVSGDPWEMIFAIRFRDASGDLGQGKAKVFLNGSSKALEIDLFDTFRQSGLSLDSQAGTLTLPLRFKDSVDDGARVLMGTRLIDAAERRSNCYSLELRFDVRTVTTLACELWPVLWGAAAGTQDG